MSRDSRDVREILEILESPQMWKNMANQTTFVSDNARDSSGEETTLVMAPFLFLIEACLCKVPSSQSLELDLCARSSSSQRGPYLILA